MLTTTSVGVSCWPTTTFPKPVSKSSLTRLMAVRSPQQLLEVNIDLLTGEMQRYFDGQARLSQLSAEAALDAKQRIEDATSALKQGNAAAQDKGRQPRRAA